MLPDSTVLVHLHGDPVEAVREALSPPAPRRRGRPSADESRRRTARFLTLAADGVPLDEAASQAGMTPERALRLVSNLALFQDILRKVRRQLDDRLSA